ncbi:glycosyltransferase family 2 protein [Prevotella sp. kh1p2]|uniref:glycosyltransferase family 2 protein n=1 Tax=Prevotella sp. kh1p2 TaxID=1761883 RepID=UPI0008B7FA1B|nr:glycosyltransferase family 2 protein [Prevotella sp. kh1p2]SET11443.1 Glycosyl transferase family 2 [Prevotella sp. kh1p2]SNU11807.1 Glycosyl transferase family 2 [Prevotellaceae bacterium KH2P17]
MKFSVTIPAYKKKYFKTAISSILNQTYGDFELIIVDDCSPEDLKSIVDCFIDERIRYYRNERNFGAEHVVDNWNKCLEYATGDYIICMGDDDMLRPNCLQDLEELIDRFSGKNVYYSRTELIDENDNVIEVTPLRKLEESVYEMIFNRWNGGSMFIGDYCYQVHALRQHGGFYSLPFAWGSDAISAYEAGKKAGIANTQEVGFQYRVNRQSISSATNNIEGKIKAIKAERKWFEDFFVKEPESFADKEILYNLRNSIDEHFVHMYSADIISGIKACPLNQTRYWLSKRKEIGMGRWDMLKCIIHGFCGI